MNNENSFSTKGKIQELIEKSGFSISKGNDSIKVSTKYYWVAGDARNGLYRGAIYPVATGTGSLKQSGSGEYMIQTSSGATSGSTSSWYSARGLRTAPNGEVFIDFAGMFSAITSNDGYLRVGFYDDDDGVFMGFQYNLETSQQEFSITTRIDGADTVVYQNDFNYNDLADIDFEKPQRIRISFGSGFGTIFYEILCNDENCDFEKWVKFHKTNVMNEANEAVISRYQLPIKFEVSNGSVAEDVYINLLEMGAGTVNGHLVDYEISDRRFGVDVIKSTPTGAKVNYVIGALRNPLTYQGYLQTSPRGNYTQFNMDHLSYTLDGQNKAGIFRILQVPQSLNLTGAFSQVEFDSKSQWSTDATYNLTDPATYVSFLSEAVETGVHSFNDTIKQLLIEHIPGYDIVLTYTTTSTLAVDVVSSMRYSEQW